MASLTPKEKEVWAGVRRPATASTNEAEADADKIGSSVDWSTYQSDVTTSTITSYSEHETYLVNNAGYTADNATRLTSKIKSALTDDDSSGTTWDEYEDYVASVTSWEEWPNLFSTNVSFTSEETDTDTGEAVAGIRVFSSPGVTFDGVSVPEGTTEIWGTQVHFSQSGSVDTSSTSFLYSNLSVSPTDPNKGDPVDITCDITNGGAQGSETVYLKENGSVVASKEVTIGSGSTKTVTFTRVYYSWQNVDLAIDGLSPITATVQPSFTI